jgi:MerR family transcriptional regulator, copper efflux regulator
MTELPIACSLSSADQAGRLASWRALEAESMLDAEVTERGASMRFRAEAELRLRRLIAAESKCCPFLEFDLRADGDDLRLSVGGPKDARPIVLELFGLLQSAAQGRAAPARARSSAG